MRNISGWSPQFTSSPGAPAVIRARREPRRRRQDPSRQKFFAAWCSVNAKNSGSRRRETSVSSIAVTNSRTLTSSATLKSTRQVSDLLAAVALLRSQSATGPVADYGKGHTAALAVYAALLDPQITEIVLADCPTSHEDPETPEFLGVLRIGDLPHNLALAYPRASHSWAKRPGVRLDSRALSKARRRRPFSRDSRHARLAPSVGVRASPARQTLRVGKTVAPVCACDCTLRARDTRHEVVATLISAVFRSRQIRLGR